jgi:hypothetical protein
MTGARQEPLNERPAGGAEDEGTETVMDWLALYMPSWGTSVVLHAAVLILVAFVAGVPIVEAHYNPYTGTFLMVPKRDAVKRDTGQLAERKGSKTPRGLNEPNPYRFMRTPDLHPFDGIGVLEVSGKIPVIGIGGGPRGGGPESFGKGSGGWGNPFPPEWIDEARKIVYVVDRSGSMTDSIEYVKAELKRSVRELGEEKEFHVIFSSSGPCVEMPTRRLVNATERNKQFAYEFIDGVIAQSETDPSDALRRAFAVRPEVVYLLTDGEFDRAIVDLVRSLNTGGKVRVNTIGFLYTQPGTSAETVLKQIAAENGGNYKFVSERDLSR